MGEVYRGRDTRLDREVAIKVLNDRLAVDGRLLSRFLQRRSTKIDTIPRIVLAAAERTPIRSRPRKGGQKSVAADKRNGATAPVFSEQRHRPQYAAP
jgi:hypothetical protein